MKGRLWITLWVVLGVAACATIGETETGNQSAVVGLPLTGDEAVEFLTTAEMASEPEHFDELAITEPVRLELSDGERTLRAIFKTENVQHRGTFRFGDGREVYMVKDSYKHEIAAFELDRMLSLELVPPCVERKLKRRKGSLCLWVEGAMTEADRKKKDIEPPDRKAWNKQMYEARLFQQLISDQDYSNIRNLLVDDNFRLYKIDSSIAFYPDSKLIDELNPPVYSRRFIDALQALDRDELEERLKPWLIKDEIRSLWDRRTKILDRVAWLIAEHGESAVLY